MKTGFSAAGVKNTLRNFSAKLLRDPDIPLIFSIFIPVFIDMILNNLIATFHSYFVADLGDSAISAVGLAGQISGLFITLFTSLCSAVTVVVSQYKGAGDMVGAKKCISQTLFTVFLISTSIAVVFYVFSGELFDIIFAGTEESIRELAIVYLKYLAVSLPFYGMFQCYCTSSRGLGNNKVPLMISVSGSVVNLIVSFAAIKLMNMGIAGAGWGLIISRVYMTAVGTAIFVKHRWLAGLRDTIMLDIKLMSSVVSLGFMISSETIIVYVGSMIKTKFLVPYGSAHFAASSIMSTFSALCLVPITVLGVVAVTLVGRYIGAGDKDEAKLILKKIIRIGCAMYGVVMVAAFFILPFIFPAYTKSDETLSLLGKLLIVETLMRIPIMPGLNIMLNGFKAAGDAKFSTVVSVMCMWIVNVGVGYILVCKLGLGVVGMLISANLSAIAKFTVMLLRLRSGKWLHKKMIK